MAIRSTGIRYRLTVGQGMHITVRWWHMDMQEVDTTVAADTTAADPIAK